MKGTTNGAGAPSRRDAIRISGAGLLAIGSMAGLLPATAMAVGIDYASLTDDELGDIVLLASQEIRRRKFDASGFSVSWMDGDAPGTFGNDEVFASVLDAGIAKSPTCGYLLVLGFEFTNGSDRGGDLINSQECHVAAYQNGVSLEGPGNVSEQGVYDYRDAFKDVRKGGSVQTQLVWVLEDATPVEIDFGGYGSTVSYTKTLVISGKV